MLYFQAAYLVFYQTGFLVFLLVCPRLELYHSVNSSDRVPYLNLLDLFTCPHAALRICSRALSDLCFRGQNKLHFYSGPVDMCSVEKKKCLGHGPRSSGSSTSQHICVSSSKLRGLFYGFKAQIRINFSDSNFLCRCRKAICHKYVCALFTERWGSLVYLFHCIDLSFYKAFLSSYI